MRRGPEAGNLAVGVMPDVMPQPPAPSFTPSFAHGDKPPIWSPPTQTKTAEARQFELTVEQQRLVETLQEQAIKTVGNMYSARNLIFEPDQASLHPQVKGLAMSSEHFKKYATAVTDALHAGRSSVEQIDKLVDDVCEVAHQNTYIRKIGAHIINTRSYDGGQRSAVAGIRDAMRANPHFLTRYSSLDSIMTNHIDDALDRRDFTALRLLCEIRDTLRPDFDHPASQAMSEALNVTAQILAGSKGKSIANVKENKSPSRQIVTKADFQSIGKNFDMEVSPDNRLLLPHAVRTYQVLGAKLASLAGELINGAPDDPELQDQARKLVRSIRLNVAEDYGKLRPRFSPERAPEQPLIPVVIADEDESTGQIIGGHTEFMPEEEVNRRGLKGATFALAASVALIAGGVGAVSHFDLLPDHSAAPSARVNTIAEPAKPTTPNTPESITSGTTDQTFTTTPLGDLDPSHVGARPSQEHTHHQQEHTDDFTDVGHLPTTGPTENSHHAGSNDVSAEQAKLDDLLKQGSLDNAAQATVDRYKHGKAVDALPPNPQYLDAVTQTASRLDIQLQRLHANEKLDEATFLQKRALLADSIAALLHPDAAAHAHNLTLELPPSSQQSIDTLTTNGDLSLFNQQPGFSDVNLLLANVLDTTNPPEVIPPTVDPGTDGGTDGGKDDDNGSKHNDNENGHDTETSKNISVIESKALDAMEAKGDDWHNRALVMRGLMEKGWTPLQISGIIGSASVESAGVELDPKTEQFGGGPGRGIIQWGSTEQAYDRFGFEDGAEKRVGTLKWYAAEHDGSWDDLDIQIGFIDWELRNSEKGAGDALQNAESPAEAADIIVNQYERPRDSNASRDKRSNYANGTYYTYMMLVNEAELDQSGNDSMRGPQIDNGMLPTFDAVKNYLDKKYDGNENGMLSGSDLETIGQQWGDAQLYPAAAEAFRQMAAAFQSDMDKPLLLSGDIDAFRPFQSQIDAYTNPDKIDLNSSSTSTDDLHMGAKPGTSNHGLGMAVDLASGVNVGSDTPEYKWMIANGPKYGFIKPDWAKPGSTKQEDWHFDWVGGVKLPSDTDDGGNDDAANNKVYDVPISSSGYGTPVLPQNYILGTPYMGYSNEGDGNVHTGDDFLAPEGSPELAVHEAKVIKAEYAPGEGGADPDGAGNYVELELDNGEPWFYEHMEEVDVKVGETVELGEEIGTLGHTGRVISSTGDGAHLHLERNVVGFTGIASHTETEAQVAAETNDPMDVLPSFDKNNEFLKDHGMAQLAGKIVIGATNDHSQLVQDSLDNATDLTDSLPRLNGSVTQIQVPDGIEEQLEQPPADMTLSSQAPDPESDDRIDLQLRLGRLPSQPEN